MSSPAAQPGIVAVAALLGWILLGESVRGEERPAPSSLGRPVSLNDESGFYVGQETPAPPATPAPAPDPSSEGLQSSRFLLGEGFGLHPREGDPALSFYVSSTQFEQGVASGGLRQAFRWGVKRDRECSEGAS